MSIPLRRLPFLAIREMIQSMGTREIFYLSLLSKKSANFVMLSIPKNSLSADFTFRRDGFLLELMPAGYFKQGHDILPDTSYRIQGNFLKTRVSSDNLYVQCEWTDTSGVQESIRKLFYRFSKAFKNSKFYMKFKDGTREEFAMEKIRFAWENGFSLDHIDFCLKNSSPESIQALLDGCNEHQTSLCFETELPEGFRYTPPPGGYKFKSLAVHYAHWVNLDDFLQCRKLFFIGEFPDLTVEYLNGLLKKIVNLEVNLENFFFPVKSVEPTDFAAIVRGLSESAIRQNGAWQGLEFERKDGLKLRISLDQGYLDLENDLENLCHF
ncbi:unnamed protein product [Caenorhabditis brenneri]